MEAKIDGIKYDTEKARYIRSKDNAKSCRAFEDYREDLYHHKGDHYFLHRYGGALSPVGETTEDGGKIAGEIITPLTREDAAVWESEEATYASIQLLAVQWRLSVHDGNPKEADLEPLPLVVCVAMREELRAELAYSLGESVQ